MGRTRGISAAFLDRGLLRAVLLAFALFLAYRFLAQVATMVLLLAAALLLAVILSAPVEALHRRNVSRALAAALIVLCTLAVLGLSGCPATCSCPPSRGRPPSSPRICPARSRSS
jgi:thiol:disulfide interchange protein